MIANDCIQVQGRRLSGRELAELQVLIEEHPQWSRHGVAKELCQRWDWRTPAGRLKTFAARSLLLKLAQRHELRLPPVRAASRSSSHTREGSPGCTPPAPGSSTSQRSLE